MDLAALLDYLVARSSNRPHPFHRNNKQTEKVQERWEQTTWAKKLAAKSKRASLTDFDRFKLMVARKEKSAIVKKHLK